PSISRPRLVNDKLAGFIPALQHRTFGVAGGYADGRGGRVEAAIAGDSGDGDPSAVLSQPGAFLTIEKDIDTWGSGVGAYLETGYVAEDGPHYTQTGLLG